MPPPPETPVKVLLLLGALDGGGAERVAVHLYNHCDPASVEIRFGLLRREGPYLAEVDPERVSALPAFHRDAITYAATPARMARMITEAAPDVVMTFGPGVDALTWPALKLMGEKRPRWIARQDSNPDAEFANLTRSRWRQAAMNAAAGMIYRSADAVAAVSRGVTARVDRQLGRTRPPARAIHNPIDIAAIETARRTPPPIDRPFVVAAGRLVHQKGFDLLIKAFARSRAAGDLDLVILGEGPLEGELKRRAAALGVADRVMFPGFQTNPWAWFTAARLYVLSSRWEGFGNVIVETMACGTAALAADCDYGPREQIEHGVSGWLVPPEDPAALTAALDRLLADDELRGRLAVAARRRARDFDVAPIAARYCGLFREVAGVA